MLKNLKIGPKLLILSALPILFMVINGLLALRGMEASTLGLRTVYLDRVVPLRDLKVIADMYAVNIVDTTHKARNGSLSYADALKNIELSTSTIEQKWKDYLATELVAEEWALINTIKPYMAAAAPDIEQLRNILRNNQPEALAEFANSRLYPAIDPVSDAFGKLVDVQIHVAEQEYHQGEARYESTRVTNIALLGTSIFLTGLLSLAMIRSITGPLTGLRNAFEALADGNLQVEVIHDGRKDEIGLMTEAITRHLAAFKMASTDQNTLIEGAKTGMLTVRVDPSRHRGDLATLAQGSNDLVEALATPLFEVATVMAKLASGDVRGRMSGAYEGDLRALKGNVNRSLDALATLLTEVSEFANALAGGDLRRAIEGDYQGEFAAIKLNLNQALAKLSEVIRTVAQSSQQVTFAAHETQTAATDVSRQAVNQAATLAEVSVAIDQTAQAVSDIAGRVERGSMLARETATAAGNGQAKLGNLTEAVERIQTGNARINQIVSLIANIADKTYVLALNAGLEAVRAGDQGRGFGLIAHQITQLSEEVSHATRDIRGLIEDATNHVESGVMAAQEANAAISQIVAAAKDTDITIEAIATAVEEQSAIAQDLKVRVLHLHDTGQATATAAEEISATMGSLADMAEHLKAEAERLRIA